MYRREASQRWCAQLISTPTTFWVVFGIQFKVKKCIWKTQSFQFPRSIIQLITVEKHFHVDPSLSPNISADYFTAQNSLLLSIMHFKQKHKLCIGMQRQVNYSAQAACVCVRVCWIARSTIIVVLHGWTLNMPVGIKNNPTRALQRWVLRHCRLPGLGSRTCCAGAANGNEQVSL